MKKNHKFCVYFILNYSLYELFDSNLKGFGALRLGERSHIMLGREAVEYTLIIRVKVLL